MDDPGLYLYIILFSLIMLSAFFSAAETAYSSLNIHRLKTYDEKKVKGAKRALLIANNFEITLSTILIGNNVVNIAIASIATMICLNLYGDIGTLIATLSSTIVVLIFGEVLPKSYAKRKPERFATSVSLPLYILIKLLKPASLPLVFLNKTAQKVINDDSEEVTVTEDELIALIDSAEEEGVIEEGESDLIKSALEFDEKTVEDILTPRIDVVAINVNYSIESIKEILFKEKYSRVPVYEDTIDNIIGILSERDFLSVLASGETINNLRSLIKEPLFVSKTMKINTLLEVLQENQAQLAIVAGEYGGTAGIVTMEDVMEELVGEIYDEHDEVIQYVTKNSDDTLLVNAEVDLDDFFEDYFEDEQIPDSEYSTVGGWAYELFEKIPKVDDHFDFDGERYVLRVSVAEMDKNRIDMLKISIIETKKDLQKQPKL